jgi:hypothetical protein
MYRDIRIILHKCWVVGVILQIFAGKYTFFFLVIRDMLVMILSFLFIYFMVTDSGCFHVSSLVKVLCSKHIVLWR